MTSVRAKFTRRPAAAVSSGKYHSVGHQVKIDITVGTPDLHLEDLAPRVIRRALARVGRYVRTELRAATPRRTGKLRRSVRSRIFLRRRMAIVGPTLYTARFVQRGTRPHPFKAGKHKKSEHIVVKINGGFADLVNKTHPGARANPFVSETAQRIKPAIRAQFAEAIRIEAAKNGSGKRG